MDTRRRPKHGPRHGRFKRRDSRPHHYNAFGQPVSHTALDPAAVDVAFGDDGLFTDATTGDDFAVNRVYNPASATWNTPDPAQADVNTYRAFGNSPTNATDPSGLDIVLNDESSQQFVKILKDDRWGDNRIPYNMKAMPNNTVVFTLGPGPDGTTAKPSSDWDTITDESRSVISSMLANGQTFEYSGVNDLIRDVKLLRNVVDNVRNFPIEFAADDPMIDDPHFNENGDVIPGVRPSAALRAVYERMAEGEFTPIMACRNGAQMHVMKAVLDVYGDEAFDNAMGFKEGSEEPFEIFNTKKYFGDNPVFTRSIEANGPQSVVPGEYVWARGNQNDGVLPGYEGSNFIIGPGNTVPDLWGGSISLGNHLTDVYLYRFRWDSGVKPDGEGMPSWSEFDETRDNLRPDFSNSEARAMRTEQLTHADGEGDGVLLNERKIPALNPLKPSEDQ